MKFRDLRDYLSGRGTSQFSATSSSTAVVPHVPPHEPARECARGSARECAQNPAQKSARVRRHVRTPVPPERRVLSYKGVVLELTADAFLRPTPEVHADALLSIMM